MSRGRKTAERLAARLVRLPLLALLALVLTAGTSHAIDLVDVASPRLSQDILPFLAGLETAERMIPIERPDSHSAVRELMTLEAKGPGPIFRWRAAGFQNSGTEAADVIITVPDQGFVGSGAYPLKAVGSRVISITTAGGIQLEPLPVTGQGAFAFTLAPGATASIAFEVNGGQLPAITMWKREAFDASKDNGSFFRGALLGISLLLAIAILALYGFRSRAVFPVAAGFAFSCVGFMLLEAGHIPSLMAGMGYPAVDLQVVRAMIEGAMAAFLILLLATMSELNRIAKLAGNLLAVAGGLSFAIPIYGLAEPMLAAAIARGLFVLTASGGFVLMFLLWRRGEVKAEQALLTWSLILLWTFLAVAVAMSAASNQTLSPILLAGLCAVLVVLSFTLAHYAFSQGYLSRHFFREAGRHALALAGARTFVWDWQPEEGELYVSPEIERALGQPAGVVTVAAAEAFLELMHPSDRTSYLAAIEDAVYDGRTPVEREFRLRHGDGSYRWFQLRARAIPGHNQRAARCIGTLVDVTNQKLAEERLLTDAVYDLVTGLPNRALFVDRLARALEAAEHDWNEGLFVLLVDIDRFKLVNDAMGHEAGDALLAVIGRRITGETQHNGSVARLPGDQFAIMFDERIGDRDVEDFATSLLKIIGRPITFDGQEYFLTASIGIAHAREQGISADQLMKDAALALYEAKRQGSESIELFTPGMRDDRAELVVLESELRRAIERNEIEVHYQPIARLADMHLAGFEALVRWRHPVLGLLAPESFVSLAEQTGMIVDIGRAVINEAGRQLGIWQRAYRPAEPVFVAVNISSAQLIEAGLIDEVKQVLHRENLMRGSFKIEVTESLVMQYPERAAQILGRLKELGVGISCDDFGTGYSSLSSLRKLPFDTLKVDRSFIADDAQDQRAMIILESIIAMGHALGLGLVAEGIEDQDQVDRLGHLGCDFGQGFFIGRPMTAKQVNDALVGLPYASRSGRTAITWLWERALKEPPQAPERRRLTAAEIESARQVEEAAKPSPRPARPPSRSALRMPPLPSVPDAEAPYPWAYDGTEPREEYLGPAEGEDAAEAPAVEEGLPHHQQPEYQDEDHGEPVEMAEDLTDETAPPAGEEVYDDGPQAKDAAVETASLPQGAPVLEQEDGQDQPEGDDDAAGTETATGELPEDEPEGEDEPREETPDRT